MTHGRTEDDRLRRLRDTLVATGAGIYLSTHVAGPVPAETLAAVHESDELELRLGRVGPDRADDLVQREKEARAVAAATIKASPERVVLTRGAAEAATTVALEVLRAARADGGTERRSMVAVDGLAPPVLAALQLVAGATASDLRRSPDVPVDLGPDVALVVMAHVDDLGRQHDPAPLGAMAGAAGARLVVDASLSAGAQAIDAGAFGADVVIVEADRWLLGPDAMAFAWLAPGLGDDAPARLRASVGPFGRGRLLALARSVGWLLMYVELPWAIERTQALARGLREAVGAIDGVELAADDEGPALLALRVEGWDARQAAEELSRSVFAIVDVDGPGDWLRVSVGAWNSADEIDRFAGRLAELAAYTPETLPRRPTLTILSGPPAGSRGS